MMAAMRITKNEAGSRYEAHEDDELVGFLEYRVVGEAVVLVHTESLREGRGVGSELAEFVLNDLRDAKVTVTCPFVKRYLEKHPDPRVTVR
jgi:uncharacterized protein